MVQVKKMRLPLSAEYSHLARLTNGSDAWIHWSGILCWCLDEDPIRPAFHETRGYASCRDRAFMPDDVRSEAVGFRPAFEAETNILDGQVCVVGTLFMDGEPVRIPTCSKFAVSYVPGATLELRPALEDENFQVRAIRVGDVLIADRVLLKNISWNDIREVLGSDKPATQDAQKPLRLSKVRLPTCEEYDSLAKAVKESNDIMHWESMYSWCQDTDPDCAPYRAIRGYPSADTGTTLDAPYRYVGVGFRPTVEILDPDILGPDGTIVMVGTLYMDDEPVRVPQNPVWNGDIPDYIPGTRLELGAPIQDAAYQVQAIKVGNILIADRVLIKNISWDDLHKQGVC